MQSCEQEVAEMLKETEKSDTELKSEAAKPSLPQWLQNAKTNKDNGKVMDQAQVNLIKTINYVVCLFVCWVSCLGHYQPSSSFTSSESLD